MSSVCIGRFDLSSRRVLVQSSSLSSEKRMCFRGKNRRRGHGNHPRPKTEPPFGALDSPSRGWKTPDSRPSWVRCSSCPQSHCYSRHSLPARFAPRREARPSRLELAQPGICLLLAKAIMPLERSFLAEPLLLN